MLVTATAISISDVPAEALTESVRRGLGLEGRHSALTRGGEYLVYAIARRIDETMYFIGDDAFSVYPFAYSSLLFTVADPRPSRLWRTSSSSSLELTAIPAWAGDEGFYEDLVEGIGGAREVFRRAVATMNLEFLVPSRIRGRCARLLDQWYECGCCEHSWEATPGMLDNEMCECPSCGRLLALTESV
ncbi:MAG: hypothetical protein IPQ07_28855 [Myxococcales bacterium]|nr:hypothetical protein [Myxococcales bacterium]